MRGVAYIWHMEDPSDQDRYNIIIVLKGTYTDDHSDHGEYVSYIRVCFAHVTGLADTC